MQVLIWSQHLLGTGHLQRSARIASALAARGHAVVLANGGPAPPTDPADYRRVDLAPISAADERFSGLVSAAGDPIDDAVWQERGEVLMGLATAKPDIMIVEMFPFGRRAFVRELGPLLERWRGSPGRPALLVSLRDVLVDKKRPKRAVETLARIRRWFDRVLVHGDPRLIGLDATFPEARAVAPWLRYTGYVAPDPPAPASVRQGVLVSAGGGAVGRHLLATAAAAAVRAGDALGTWTLIAGRGLAAADWASLQTKVGDRVELVRHVDDLPARLAQARLSISQAGYNTVAEAMAARCPMVLVPFAAGDETEQTHRAVAVAEQDAATVVEEQRLDAETLAAAALERAARPFPSLSLDVDGATRTARLVEAIGAGRA